VDPERGETSGTGASEGSDLKRQTVPVTWQKTEGTIGRTLEKVKGQRK